MEHDSCGVAFVVDLQGRPAHRIVELGLESLCRLEHRGAKGADPGTGDGAGVLVQIPARYLRPVARGSWPPAGAYATGIGVEPPEPPAPAAARRLLDQDAAEERREGRCWRE